MATQPTNLPVSSESSRDLKFNAGKIDEFVTSNNHVYVDRFGNDHRTIEGINYDANQAILNYGYITKDSFEDGNTLSIANECLRWKSNGEYYRWDGAFPKVVPPGSTPDSTGGIGKGKWVSVGDASLRSDLGVLTSSINLFEGDEKFLVTGSPGAIKTNGYHQANDGGDAVYIKSGTGTPGDTDGISFFVTNNGIKFNHIGGYNSAQAGITDSLTENQASKLTKLASLVAANGQGKVYFNVNSLRADNDLIGVDNIRMIGNGSLISSNPNNHYKQIFKPEDKIDLGKVRTSS